MQHEKTVQPGPEEKKDNPKVMAVIDAQNDDIAARVYADNAAAVAAGLEIGTVYRTGDQLKIVHA